MGRALCAQLSGPDALVEHPGLLQRRRTLGLTQEQLAATADVHQSEISRTEIGRGNPTIPHALRPR
jgi:predicted transcriptional regulator